MSRVSLIQQLYSEKKTALEFNFDRLSIPPMNVFLSALDVQQLHQIATSVRYAGNIDKKYEMIDKVMKHRSFYKLAAGTNRVVYYHLEDPRFVAKIAIDRVGLGDNPKEFENQKYLKPFCTKVFEVDKTGTIALVERVNPITSIEEFASIGEDVFNLITQKIIGKYVLDDIGVTKWMNYGCRMGGFGPVILDFPYVYELDGNKIYCQKKIKTPYGEHICGGEIDYDSSFDFLVCSKCGKTYKARDLENKTASIKLEMNSEGSSGIMTRARIIKNGKVYKDSAPTSKTYVSKEQFEKMVGNVDLSNDVVVDRVIHLRSMKRENKYRHQSELMMQYYGQSNATPARINGLKKKPVTNTSKPSNNKNKEYRTSIKVDKNTRKQRTVTEELDLIDPSACDEEAVALAYAQKHYIDSAAGRTAHIRTNLKPTKHFPYGEKIKSTPSNPVKVPPIASFEPMEVNEYEPVDPTFKESIRKTITGEAIKDILANEDNVTKIEAEIEEAEYMRDGEEMLKKELAEESENEEENLDDCEEEIDAITENAIEMIKRGMYQSFAQPSEDECLNEEADDEPQEQEEPPEEENEYEIPEMEFSDYKEMYRRRKKRNDDMSEY